MQLVHVNTFSEQLLCETIQTDGNAAILSNGEGRESDKNAQSSIRNRKQTYYSQQQSYLLVRPSQETLLCDYLIHRIYTVNAQSD